MINEEVTRQVIAVKKKALHLTAREVIKLMKMILNKAEKEKNGLKDFIGKQKPTTVKDLVKKGKVETLELNDVDLKNLKRELNKSGVKFSIKKDAVAKFAGKDKKKESVIDKLNHFREKVKNTPQKDKIKEKHKEQSL